MKPATVAAGHQPPPVVFGLGPSIGLAVAVTAGCVAAIAVPLVPVALATLVALAVGRPWLVVACGFALAGALAHRAEAGLGHLETGVLDEVVELVGDPEPAAGGWRAELRMVDGTRIQASGYGSVGWELSRHTAGDYLVVGGSVRPLPADSWLRWRHLAGRAALTEASPTGERSMWWQPANQLRAIVNRGAELIPSPEQALYTGIIMGDDRFQTDSQQARFRAAGLTHLMAVSGQNVAFVLAVAEPLTRRLPRRWRTVVMVGAIATFALATRLEPSVIRASTTAVVASGARASGARFGGLRGLALTVAACCLIDPFLPRVLGFQLSVLASAGIVAGAAPLAERLTLLGPLREATAVTLAAQAAVWPLLAVTFGPPSLVSIPANVAAGWAAGAVMLWGLTVGVVAAFVPDPIGVWLQWPATMLCWWIDSVATLAVRMPTFGAAPAVLVAVGLGLWFGRRASIAGPRWSAIGIGAVAAVLLIGGQQSRPTAPLALQGAMWFPALNEGPSVLVVDEGADGRLVADLVDHRVDALDVVISQSGDRRMSPLMRDVADVVPVEVVLAPAGHEVVGAHRVIGELAVATAYGVLSVQTVDERLEVELSSVYGEPG